MPSVDKGRCYNYLFTSPFLFSDFSGKSKRGATNVQIVEHGETVTQSVPAPPQASLTEISKILEEISKQQLPNQLQDELKSIRQELESQKPAPINKLDHFASILADYITIAPVAVPVLNGLLTQLNTYLGPR